MSRGTLRGRATSLSLAVVICVGSWALVDSVRAQEKKEPPADSEKASPTKAPPKEAQPDKAGQDKGRVERGKESKKADEGKDGKKRSLKPIIRGKDSAAAKAAALKAAQQKKRGKNLPAPTVVLKEGEMPGIKFDAATYDFGRIRSGEDVQHDYWFTNTGTGPLELLRVKPG